ncbi:MAG TPA: hypothetical protein VF132_07010 [Rudaea sp.]
MKTEITLPDLVLLAMTRGMLGAGIGLLAAGRLNENVRRPVGWVLVAAGLLTTIPLALQVFGRIDRDKDEAIDGPHGRRFHEADVRVVN